MKYQNSLNNELKEYFNILCNGDYPDFIEKYIYTKPLQRLDNIGQFCGCEYTKLYNIKYPYSRLNHSVACALITWRFTKDKKQTLFALFHDLGTPAFSHSIDFMLNDSENQESSEKDIKDIINSSDEIKKCLSMDNIKIEDVTEMEGYSVVDIKDGKQKLCVDRLEGIFHTVLIWQHTWKINTIKHIYKHIIVLDNGDNQKELGFDNVSSAEKFFAAVYCYSLAMQKNINKYVLQFIGDILKKCIEQSLFTIDDLYTLSEKTIINMIKKSNYKKQWNIFSNALKVNKTNKIPKGVYYVSVKAKNRYIIPICVTNDNKVIRINKCSEKTNNKINKYLEYKDKDYTYISDISI
jgi:hypothetical protein